MSWGKWKAYIYIFILHLDWIQLVTLLSLINWQCNHSLEIQVKLIWLAGPNSHGLLLRWTQPQSKLLLSPDFVIFIKMWVVKMHASLYQILISDSMLLDEFSVRFFNHRRMVRTSDTHKHTWATRPGPDQKVLGFGSNTSRTTGSAYYRTLYLMSHNVHFSVLIPTAMLFEGVRWHFCVTFGLVLIHVIGWEFHGGGKIFTIVRPLILFQLSCQAEPHLQSLCS